MFFPLLHPQWQILSPFPPTLPLALNWFQVMWISGISDTLMNGIHQDVQYVTRTIHKDTQLTVAAPWITLTHPAVESCAQSGCIKMKSKRCITKTDWKCKSHGSYLTQRCVSRQCTCQGCWRFRLRNLLCAVLSHNNLSSPLSAQAALEPELHSSRSECSKYIDTKAVS